MCQFEYLNGMYVVQIDLFFATFLQSCVFMAQDCHTIEAHAPH